MSLTKAGITESICNRCGFSKNKSSELLQTILKIIRCSRVMREKLNSKVI